MKSKRTIVRYRGVLLHRNTSPGYRLRWSALGYGAADTLEGMKQLVVAKLCGRSAPGNKAGKDHLMAVFRYHVTGAVERGEKEPIIEQPPAPRPGTK